MRKTARSDLIPSSDAPAVIIGVRRSRNKINTEARGPRVALHRGRLAERRPAAGAVSGSGDPRTQAP